MEQEEGLTLNFFKKKKKKKLLVSFKGELSIQVVQITICNYISVH